MTTSYLKAGDDRRDLGKTNDANVGMPERWLSTAGGAALTAVGLWRRGVLGWGLAALGANLVLRGVRGRCPVYRALGINTAATHAGRAAVIKHQESVKVDHTITVNAPADELYRYWRSFENLPHIMSHLESVTPLDERRSHWVAKAPGGRRIEWDAEIITERENELIGWRSLENADVANAGSVNFSPAPGGRGTEVKVSLAYDPPAGRAGALIAGLLGEEPHVQVREDLRRFKQTIEAREPVTTEGQPAAR